MKRKSCMVLRIGAAALLCFVMVFSSCDMLTGADGKDGNDGKDGGQAAAIYEKLTVSNAAALASGFAGLAEKYSPDDKIEATVTLAAGFDFAGLSAEIDTTVESFQITGTDPVNGLFTAIGADNIYVHYDFSASGWTGLDSGGDGVPFFLDTTDIGENADALAEVNLNAVRPHRNQILSIVMPAAIVAVGDYLFYDLQGLQKVSFAGCGNLTTINSYAFAAASFNNTALTDISFDGCTKLSYIGDYAFLYSANLRGSNGTTTLDLSAIDVPLLTIRDYAFFRAGVNGAMKSVKLPGGGWFGNNAFVRNMGLESVWITDGRWGELTWNNFLYLDKPTEYDSYGYSSLPPLWVRETADGGRGFGTGFVLNFFVPDTITLQRMAKGSDLLTNSEDDGNYFAGQLIPTKDGADVYRGQSRMILGGTITDTITAGGTEVSTDDSTWTVYSQPEAKSEYAVGTMTNGVITITMNAPVAAKLDRLTPEKAMAITGDPSNYYLAAQDAINKSENASKAQANLPGDMWMVGAGPYASKTGYFWQPVISNNSGVPVNNAKFLAVKDFYYPTTITQHTVYTYRVQKIGPGDSKEFDTDGDGQPDAFKDDILWSDWRSYGSDKILEAKTFDLSDNDAAAKDPLAGLTFEQITKLGKTSNENILWYSPDVEDWKPKAGDTGSFGYVKTKEGSEYSFLTDAGENSKTFTINESAADDDTVAANAKAVGDGKSDNPQIYMTGEYYYFELLKTEVVVDESSDWKKASRTGVDTYCIINHVTDDNYYTDQRKVYYVYVSQDVNLLRTAKSGNEVMLDHDKELGVVQTYYEEIPEPVKTRYDITDSAAAWLMNHHSVHLALKAGWNQVEEKTTYPGEISSPAEYRGIKTYRISAGKQGPFSTFDASNTSNFSTSSGKAYMKVDADGASGTADDIEKQYYSDAGHEIPVPWKLEAVSSTP